MTQCTLTQADRAVSRCTDWAHAHLQILELLTAVMSRLKHLKPPRHNTSPINHSKHTLAYSKHMRQGSQNITQHKNDM